MRTDLKCWYVVVNNMLLIIKIIVNNMFVPVVFFMAIMLHAML